MVSIGIFLVPSQHVHLDKEPTLVLCWSCVEQYKFSLKLNTNTDHYEYL